MISSIIKSAKILFLLSVLILISFNLQAQWEKVGDIRLGYASLGIAKSDKAIFDKTHQKIYTWGAWGGASAIYVYDILTNSFIRRIETRSTVHNLYIDEVREQAYISTGNGFDRIDLNTNKLVDFKVEPSNSNYYTVQTVVDRNNVQIISNFKTFTAIDGVHSSMLKFYDQNTLELKHTTYLPQIKQKGIIVSQKSNKLFIRCEIESEIFVMNLSNYQIVDTIPIQSQHGSDKDNEITWFKIDTINNYLFVPETYRADPQGDYYYFSFLSVYDIYTHELVKEIDFLEADPYGGTQGWFNNFAINPEKDEIYICSLHDNIKIYSISEFIETESLILKEGSGADIVIPSNQNSIVYVIGNDLSLYDINNRDYIGSVRAGTLPMSLNTYDQENKVFVREIQNWNISLLQDGNVNIKSNLLNTFRYFLISDDWMIIENLIDEVNNKYIAFNWIYTFVYDFINKESSQLPIEGVFDAIVSKDGERTFFLQWTDNIEKRLLEYNKSLEFVKSYKIPANINYMAYDNNNNIYLNSKDANTIFRLQLEDNKLDSVKVGINLRDIKYIPKESSLIAWNAGVYEDNIGGPPTEVWPNMIYKIDSANFEVIDSIAINFALWSYFETQNKLLVISGQTIITLDLTTFEIESNQDLSNDISVAAITINELTNTLYISNKNNGFIYKFQNPNYPSYPPPPAPKIDSITIGDNQLFIHWKEYTDAENGYNIYQQKEENPWIKLNRDPISSTNYTDKNLVNNSKYKYKLASIGKYFIESEYSDVKEAIPLNLPDFTVSIVESDPSVTHDGKSAEFIIAVEKEQAFSNEINITIDSIVGGVDYNFTNEISSTKDQSAENLSFTDFNLISSHSFKTLKEGTSHQYTIEAGEESAFISLTLDLYEIIPVGMYSFNLITQGTTNLITEGTINLVTEGTTNLVLETTIGPIVQEALQKHTYKIPFSVQEEVFTSFSFSAQTSTIEESVTLSGESILSPDSEIKLFSNKGKEEFIIEDTLIIDQNNKFSKNLSFDLVGSWGYYLESNGIKSDTQSIVVERAPTFIAASIEDLSAIDTSKMITINGKVNPFNTEGGVVSLEITKPDNSITLINDIPYNFLGTFGYDILIDQIGIWKILASWDGDDKYFGTVSNPLIIPVHTSAGRAIILTSSSNNDPLDNDSLAIKLSSYAFKIMEERAIKAEDIYFMNENLDLDVNGDGSANEVDAINTVSNLKDILTLWAKDDVSQIPTLVYICASVTDDHIYINDSELITLDTLSKYLGENAILITEGNTSDEALDNHNLDSIKYIASSSASASNYITSTLASFSYYFFNNLYLGYSLGESFERSSAIIKAFPDIFNDQNPSINFNSNTTFNEQADFTLANSTYFGATYTITNLPPNISGSGSNTGSEANLQSSSKSYKTSSHLKSEVESDGLTFWTTINDFEGNIDKIKGVLIDPIGEKSFYDFELNTQTNIYTAYYNQSTYIGIYNLYLFASDKSGNLSLPRVSKFFIRSGITGIDNDNIDDSKQLNSLNVYPNPFKSSIEIYFTLEKQENVTLKIYTNSGKLIQILEQRSFFPGTHTIKWDGIDESGNSCKPGYYILVLEAGKKIESTKLVKIN